MSSRLRRWCAVVAALGAVALAAGCTADGTTSDSAADAPHFHSVVVLGDSITAMSVDAIDQAFRANGYDDVRIEGLPGRRIAVGDGTSKTDPLSGTRELASLLGEGVDPEVWVVELGTNDIAKYGSVDEYGALIDELLLQIPADAPVVWVNTWWQDQPDHSRMFNTALGQRIAERGNAVVADWYSVASAPGQQVIGFDGVHPTEDGSRALGMVMVAATGQL